MEIVVKTCVSFKGYNQTQNCSSLFTRLVVSYWIEAVGAANCHSKLLGNSRNRSGLQQTTVRRKVKAQGPLKSQVRSKRVDREQCANADWLNL